MDSGKNKIRSNMKFYLKGAIMVCGLVILANTIGALIQTKEKHNANILLNANFMTTKTEAVKIYKTYIPPHNWTKYVISNSFVLFVPNTVELREEFDSYTQAAKDTYWYGYEINLNDVVFQQKGLAVKNKEAFNTYARIMLRCTVGEKGNYVKANEHWALSTDDILYFQDLAKQSAGVFEIIDSPKVHWIKLDSTYCIEVQYVRKGVENYNTCVSSYYLFNDDKMANIILSYRQQDFQKWEEDFSNVIRTFKWIN